MANIYDCIRAVALLVLFFALVWRDKKVWLKAIAFIYGGSALWLMLCPTTVINFETTDVTPDGLHCYLCRIIAVVMAGHVCLWYLCRDSRDETFTGSLILSKFMTTVLVLFTIGYAHFQYSDKFNDRLMIFHAFSLVLLGVGSLVQLIRGRFVLGRREQKGGVGVILRLIFLLQLILGLSQMAFPRLFLSIIKPVHTDEIHLHLTRLVGAATVGFSFLTWYVPAFRNDEDKRSFFIVGAMGPALMVSTMTISFLTGTFDREQYIKLLTGMSVGVLPILGLFLMRQVSKSTGPVNSGGYYTRSKSN